MEIIVPHHYAHDVGAQVAVAPNGGGNRIGEDDNGQDQHREETVVIYLEPPQEEHGSLGYHKPENGSESQL